MEKYMMILAVLADLFIGGASGKYHPVMLIKSLIGSLENRLLSEYDSSEQKRKKGVRLVCIVISTVYAVSVAVSIALLMMGPWWFFGGSILILALMIVPRSLAESGIKIKQCLAEGDFVGARERIGLIADRDTDEMDEQEIARASIETIADDMVGKVIAPLFYFFLGGFPLAVLCRAVNTMSSMIACENEKYADFGYAAAKLDEVFNYIPARLTAFLLILASLILQYDGKKAMEIVRRDAGRHSSPNNGYPEAAAAGALHIRLGGRSCYGGEERFCAYMGDAIERINVRHIEKMMRLLYLAAILFCLIGISIEMAGEVGGGL